MPSQEILLLLASLELDIARVDVLQLEGDDDPHGKVVELEEVADVAAGPAQGACVHG